MILQHEYEITDSNYLVYNISYFYIEKWTFKGKCEVYYRAERDKKAATCL